MTGKILGIVLITICGLFYTAGDVAMKKWIDHPSIAPYLIGAALYIIGMNFLAFSYKYRNIAVATALCVIVNILTLTVVSWFLFKEPLSIKQMTGIALSIGAVIFLES
jgi:multidrug transporter EmrE-like cation transporter